MKSGAEYMRPYNRALQKIIHIYYNEYITEYRRIKGSATGRRVCALASNSARAYIREKHYSEFMQLVAVEKEGS